MGHQPRDLEPLAEIIGRMPGGSLIGDAWRSEPPHVLYVCADSPEGLQQDLLDAVRAGFVCHLVDHDPARFTVAVPTTVADMLIWYADEYGYTAEDLSGYDLGVHLDVDTFARLTATVLPGVGGDVWTAVEQLDTLAVLAEEADVDREGLITLWRSLGRDIEDEQLLQLYERVIR